MGYEHVMVDIETLGTNPGCVILTLGAIPFDLETGEMGDSFYRAINPVTAQSEGLTIEAETVCWWLKTAKHGHEEAVSGEKYTEYALLDFFQWWEGLSTAKYFWCHGAPFDEPIIRTAWYQLHIYQGRVPIASIPWDRRDIRDTRTLLWLGGVDIAKASEDKDHNALVDCRRQIEGIVKAYQKVQAQPGSVSP